MLEKDRILPPSGKRKGILACQLLVHTKKRFGAHPAVCCTAELQYPSFM